MKNNKITNVSIYFQITAVEKLYMQNRISIIPLNIFLYAIECKCLYWGSGDNICVLEGTFV